MSVPQVGVTINPNGSDHSIIQGFDSITKLMFPETLTDEKIEEVFNLFKCASCSQKGVKNMCSVCKNVSYCDTTCQKNDRPYHKNNCNAPSYYTEDAIVELLKDFFKNPELETKDFHFLFEGEKNTRVHNLCVINNPDCLTLEAHSKLTVSMKRIIATDGTFPSKFNSRLKEDLSSQDPLYLYTGQIKGIRSYDVFSKVTLKF